MSVDIPLFCFYIGINKFIVHLNTFTKTFEMRSYYLLLAVLSFTLVVSCKKEEEVIKEPVQEQLDPTVSYDLTDVAYGSDPEQVMDIYLPANRSAESTQVFFLIHGGGWSAGDKENFQSTFNALKFVYPDCAIVNMNYRLATNSSPGYPKQINDVEKAIQFIFSGKYDLAHEICFFGNSAGGHLAMLYAYKFDDEGYIKAICNTVGPADFTDPSYTSEPAFEYGLISLVGPVTYDQNPALYQEVSPVYHITQNAPKTLSFYGDQDPLVPATQVTILHDKLSDVSVYNEWTLYAGEGHGNWNTTNANDYQTKIISFITNHFIH